MSQDFCSGKAESKSPRTLSTSKNHAKKHRFEEFFFKHKNLLKKKLFLPNFFSRINVMYPGTRNTDRRTHSDCLQVTNTKKCPNCNLFIS